MNDKRKIRGRGRGWRGALVVTLVALWAVGCVQAWAVEAPTSALPQSPRMRAPSSAVPQSPRTRTPATALPQSHRERKRPVDPADPAAPPALPMSLPDAPSAPALSPTEMLGVVRGGRIYDNWAVELGANLPKKNHPSYPAWGSLGGGDTWRCTACHGWDYQGISGGGDGQRIPGLAGLAGAEEGRLSGYLRDEHHQYRLTMISDEEARDLTAFIRFGQVAMDRSIDRATLKGRGNARDGAEFFHGLCSRCHGVDGRHLDAEHGGPAVRLGEAANRNPWMALHKIRNGQPGVKRPDFAVLLGRADFDNMLAYIQSLPRE